MAIDNPVEIYLREVAHLQPLTPAAETQLIAQIRKGDRDAETAQKNLGEAHLHEVVAIAKEYSQDASRLLDLILEGNIGLFRALNELDQLSDASFSEHADPYIRQAIADAAG